MVRVKSIPKKFIPKPKLNLKGKGKSNKKSRYNLRPIPSRTSLAQTSAEPGTSVAPETQQVVSTQPSSPGVVNTQPVSPSPGPSQTISKKGPKQNVHENQVFNICILKLIRRIPFIN